MNDVPAQRALRASTATTLIARLRALPAPTPRERAALACAAAAACFCAVWIAGDWRARAVEAAVEADAAAARLEALLTRDLASPAKDIAAAGAVRAAQWAIVEASSGLAQAQVAHALEVMARDAGLANVAVIPVEERRGGATRARASNAIDAISPLAVTVEAEGDWASFMAFLDALARSDVGYQIVAIDRAEGDGGPGTLSITLRAAHLHREAGN